jgi:hypothetical protein
VYFRHTSLKTFASVYVECSDSKTTCRLWTVSDTATGEDSSIVYSVERGDGRTRYELKYANDTIPLRTWKYSAPPTSSEGLDRRMFWGLPYLRPYSAKVYGAWRSYRWFRGKAFMNNFTLSSLLQNPGNEMSVSLPNGGTPQTASSAGSNCIEKHVNRFWCAGKHWYSGGWSPIGSSRHCGHQQTYCASPGWLWWWRNWWNDDGQGKAKYSEKTCPCAALSTTNPTCSARTRTRAAAMGSQRLTAWATARHLDEQEWTWPTGQVLGGEGTGNVTKNCSEIKTIQHGLAYSEI